MINLLEKIVDKIRMILQKNFFILKYKKKIKFFKRVYFRRYFCVNITNNGEVTIGNDVFFNRNCSINCHKSINIGDNTILGENVKIYDHNHVFTNSTMAIRKQGFTSDKVIIGKNCWIGSNATILKGVTIGDNVIIGANCLVYKSIPSNKIVKNNSNLVIKEIYENINI